MDDLSEKLAGILNDPETMDRVRKMAENILGEEEKTSSPLESFSDNIGAENNTCPITRKASWLTDSL